MVHTNPFLVLTFVKVVVASAGILMMAIVSYNLNMHFDIKTMAAYLKSTSNFRATINRVKEPAKMQNGIWVWPVYDRAISMQKILFHWMNPSNSQKPKEAS
jgi:hypothetical protein